MDLEKYSSAITLSDMEVFVFPELMYSLLLANIMSPYIWGWRDIGSFKKIENSTTHRKFMRMKQHIMDEYEFNLDLETWGLTTKQKEIDRFSKYLSLNDLTKSNALFGYEGDKYYFDIDIRRHFGLDKYNTDTIPYWKTETVEAMNAFRYKPGYKTGAGECVSLSALYAAAAFIMCGIPLEDIYMILTPLHSQNFIDLSDGILTNNRRIVTKIMWFNGSEISAKAQRALKNEQVTIVSHLSGHIHVLYNDATIDKTSYNTLLNKMNCYLTTETTLPVFASFLRANGQYQKYFQMCQDCRNQARFIKAEVLFHYEHGSKYRIGDETFAKLLEEVSDQEYYYLYPLPDRIRCDQLEEFLTQTGFDVRKEEDRQKLRSFIAPYIPQAQQFVNELHEFAHTEAKLPNAAEKNFVSPERLNIKPDMNREEIIEYLESMRSKNAVADLAFYAYRDLSRCDWRPFIKASIERCPVSITDTKDFDLNQVYDYLLKMNNQSIYDNQRIAHPDEVENYKHADGVEKAVYLANIIHERYPDDEIKITIDGKKVILCFKNNSYNFESGKGFFKELVLPSILMDKVCV